MSIGRMDRQITIQEDVGTQDAHGQVVPDWQDIATNPTVWAEFLPVSGQEFYQARQVNAVAVANFRIYYRTDVLRKMRLTFEGDTYDIVDASEDRRFGFKEFLLIRGEARVS